ncbi:MAG: 3-isopropylmalate dehydratase [Candidatus Omnitrophica bacterium CG1_02_49_10]|nr:MAG: 3-isopropylmalate dehydratase [Candidatus Omnitrophica bacterium CG1_02_49_10]
MKMEGRAHKFGDDINTDYIISGRYKFRIENESELASHLMEDLDKDFSKKVKKGDVMVAGRNFGCGSSREQAPVAIKAAGIPVVAAKSFARIFYRNAFNIGLLLIECDTDGIDGGDELSIDLEKGILSDKTKGRDIILKPVPKVAMKIFEDGGFVSHFKKYGGIRLES